MKQIVLLDHHMESFMNRKIMDRKKRLQNYKILLAS